MSPLRPLREVAEQFVPATNGLISAYTVTRRGQEPFVHTLHLEVIKTNWIYCLATVSHEYNLYPVDCRSDYAANAVCTDTQSLELWLQNLVSSRHIKQLVQTLMLVSE